MKINKNCFYKKMKMKSFLIGKNNVTKNTGIKVKVKNSSLALTVGSVAHLKMKRKRKLIMKLHHWKNKRNRRNNCGKEQRKNERSAEMNLLWWLNIKMNRERRTLRSIYKMIDSRLFMKTHFSQSTLQTLNSITEKQEMFSNKL